MRLDFQAPYTRKRFPAFFVLFTVLKGVENNQLITWNNTKTQENVFVLQQNCHCKIHKSSFYKFVRGAGRWQIQVWHLKFQLSGEGMTPLAPPWVRPCIRWKHLFHTPCVKRRIGDRHSFFPLPILGAVLQYKRFRKPRLSNANLRPYSEECKWISEES